MIKANELRIGNFVLWDNEDIYSIKGIGNNGVRFNNDHGQFRLNKRIYPIPLTPEILEKAGFEGNRTGFYHSPNGKPYSLYLNNEQEVFLYFGDYDTNIKIKHLHHLQNLYFALTGTELEINL